MWEWNRFVPVAIVGTIVSLLPISVALALEPEEIAAQAAKATVKPTEFKRGGTTSTSLLLSIQRSIV
jgi:hypothetical protein